MVLARIALSDEAGSLTATLSPDPLESGTDRDLKERVAALEALIEEARRRARRRRQLYAAAVITAIAAGAAAYFGHGGGGDASLGDSAAAGSPNLAAFRWDLGRWGPSHGPEGGFVPALAINPANPQVIYAGGWGNVFKSSNGGRTWKDVTAEPWGRVTALAIDPTRPAVVYAGTDRGIAKTVDGGRRWRMVNGGLFQHETRRHRGHRLAEGFLTNLIVDAHRSDTVYAVTDRGLFRTTNGGGHWRGIGARAVYVPNCVNCFIGLYSPVAVAIDPQHAQTIYASWAGRATSPVYKSTDGGDHWRVRGVAGTTPDFLALALDPHHPGTLYAVPGNYNQLGVLKSKDDGATWRIVGLRKQHLSSVWVDPSGAIVAITSTGAFKSRDGGDSWQAFGQRAALAYGSLVTDPSAPATVYGAGEDGVVKSVNGGRTWRSVNSGLVSTFVSSLVLADGSSKVLYAVASPDVFKSADGGRRWRLADGGIGKQSVLALAAGPHGIYAGTRGTGVFESLDSGLSWRPVNTGLTASDVEALAIDPRKPSTVYAVGGTDSSYVTGNGGTVFKTVDDGATWRTIAGPTYVQTVAVDPQDDEIVFAGTRDEFVRSSDGGDNWRTVATAAGGAQTIVFDSLDPRTVYAGTRSGGILKSSDGGKTWVASNTGLTNKSISALAVDPRAARTVYASTGGGVFRSTNGARSWHRYGRGLSATGVAAFAIDPAGSVIYAGTDGDGVVGLRLR
jgi:photosystem II stability/assembly factor-like uncharacterized protein